MHKTRVLEKRWKKIWPLKKSVSCIKLKEKQTKGIFRSLQLLLLDIFFQFQNMSTLAFNPFFNHVENTFTHFTLWFFKQWVFLRNSTKLFLFLTYVLTVLLSIFQTSISFAHQSWIYVFYVQVLLINLMHFVIFKSPLFVIRIRKIQQHVFAQQSASRSFKHVGCLFTKKFGRIDILKTNKTVVKIKNF